MIGGKEYMVDAKGRHVPVDLVKPTDKLIDQTVRTVMGYADDLNAQIARFRAHCFDDIAAMLALMAEQYGMKSFGGAKGNMTFTSYDGLQKIQVAIADHFSFGPELQIAKALIDECIADWASDARSEIRVLVEHAFEPRKEGKVSAEAILSLRRVKIEDERWGRAMEAINDAIRVEGSKTYLRFYRRPTTNSLWENVTINIAAAKEA
jgi:hypothetical protein